MGEPYHNFTREYNTFYNDADKRIAQALGQNINPIYPGAVGMTIGDRIGQAIKARGITKSELARISGVSKQNIGHLTHGTSKGGVTPETLFALADALRVEARWLAFGTGPRESGAKLDTDHLVTVILELIAAAEKRGQGWPLERLIRLAVDLYDLWGTAEGAPTPEQALRLLDAQRRET